MTITEPTTELPNGVNVEALFGASNALREAPAAAEFTWRASNEWVSGTHSRTTVGTFTGVGADHDHRQPFVFDADHPEVFAAEDNGATPVEAVLHALAGCLTGGIASVAAARKVNLTKVTSRIEADMNLYGILGIDSEVRNGFNNVRISFDVEGDAPAEKLQEIVAQSQARSAVYDILSNPVAVDVSVS